MAIKSQNKISTHFSLVALINIVFLLLVFFLLTSTLVSPNAIKLQLPSSSSGKIISEQTTSVSINAENQIFVNQTPTTKANLQQLLAQSLIGQNEGVIVLRADRKVPLEYLVTVIDAVTQMNDILKTKYKVILATEPGD